MKILLCASECAPFAKTGGLATVIGSLPKALKTDNCEVRVIMPYYKRIKEKNIAYYEGYAYVRINDNMEYVGIFHAIYDDIDYYFIDNEKYFNRDNLYGYYDDGERFAFFNMAVFEAMRVIDYYPNILHINDWQTGLMPYILKEQYKNDWHYEGIKTVLSIHNLLYQGIFPMNIMDIFDFPFSPSLEFDGFINYLKTAIVECDYITTVSPSYRDETLSEEYGCRMENLLNERKDKYIGILNGIDVNKYNPETDLSIAKNYTIKNYISGKRANKIALLNELGFDSSSDAPIFSFISRFVNQKGVDIIIPIMEEILKFTDSKFIFMSGGDKDYEEYFSMLENKYPKRVKCYNTYLDVLAQKIYAGSDIYLMPSKFEPCGISQLIAMRYGAIPLIRETGGLKDTVIPYKNNNTNATGFSFKKYNSVALNDTIMKAIYVYNNNKGIWQQMMKNAIERDFSWNESAKKYLEIYEILMNL